MNTDTAFTSRHAVAAGQSLHIWGRSGSSLHIDGGRAYVTEPPEWLAERCIEEPQRLLNGGTHRLSRSGWVVVYAVFPVRLTIVTPPSPLFRTLRGLHVIWMQLRQGVRRTTRARTSG
ncbi:hypothetical protein [Chitinimonas naiadis]